MTDVFFQWPALTSTGASSVVFDNVGLRTCQQITVSIETRTAVDTATVGIEHARTSTSPFVRVGGSTEFVLGSSAASESTIVALTGPFFALRPYVLTKTASTTVVIVALVGV